MDALLMTLTSSLHDDGELASTIHDNWKANKENHDLFADVIAIVNATVDELGALQRALGTKEQYFLQHVKKIVSHLQQAN